MVPGWLLEILVDGRVDMSSDGVRWRTLEPGTGILCAPRAVHFERTAAVGRRMPYRSVYAIFADETGRLHEWLDSARQFWWVKDDERRRHLFLYTLQSSVTSETVSAIECLLKGKSRMVYQSHVDDYRQRLAGSEAWYPAWVKAKIRPYLATLHPN